MKQHLRQPEQSGHSAESGQPGPLVPGWAKVVLALFTLLVFLAYASPDMRAVYVAAWAACF